MGQPHDIATLNHLNIIPESTTIVAGKSGLPMVRIAAAAASAEIYLHGAHLTSWKPKGFEEIIFVSENARFEDGTAIRGGIPVCFPWFRAKSDNPQAPAHGVVRTKAWQLESIIEAEGSVIVTLATESDGATRQWWPYDFRLIHRITVGAELKLQLIATNTGKEAFQFEEALHTYHRVGDVTKARISGLDQVHFLDNRDGNREKTQQGDIVMAGSTDNAYLGTSNALEINDPAVQRCVHIEKENSSTTVIWNPWEDGAKAMKDMGDDEWRQMACIEASNILSAAITLRPGEQHEMQARLRVVANTC
jgi:glucose-6-phosphate 1-epimerase